MDPMPSGTSPGIAPVGARYACIANDGGPAAARPSGRSRIRAKHPMPSGDRAFGLSRRGVVLQACTTASPTQDMGDVRVRLIHDVKDQGLKFDREQDRTKMEPNQAESHRKAGMASGVGLTAVPS